MVNFRRYDYARTWRRGHLLRLRCWPEPARVRRYFARAAGISVRFLPKEGMDLGNISAWELDHRRPALRGSVGLNQDVSACGLRPAQGLRKIRDLVAGYFASIRIGKVSISRKHGDRAEGGVDP